MKVFLTLPSSRFALKDTLGLKSPPLGLAYLAAMAEKDGHEVKILDAPTLQLDASQIVSEIIHFRPDVLGLSATTFGIDDALAIISLAKEAIPGLFTVIGGPHVSFTDEETLKKCRSCDVIVRGEGEETFREILRRKAAGDDLSEVEGVTYRQNSGFVRNRSRPFIEDLDSLPLPSYHLLPMDQYVVAGYRFGCIITSRGCPFKCNFCSSSNLLGKRWRFRSPENVVEEMEFLRDRYGLEEVEFLDDTFTLNPRRAHAICDLIIRRGLKMLWMASSRVNSIDMELARKMKKAGCAVLYLGIESGSQAVLDSIGKGIRLEHARRAIQIARKVGLNTIGTFILGNLRDTVRTIRKTIRFAKELSPNYAQFTILTPYPGTPLYDDLRAKGILSRIDWSKFTIVDAVIPHPTISAKKLRRYLEWAYISFYLRPKFLLQEIRNKNFYIVPRALLAAARYFFPRLFRRPKGKPVSQDLAAKPGSIE